MKIIVNEFTDISGSDLKQNVDLLERKLSSYLTNQIKIIYGAFEKKIDYIVLYEVSMRLGLAFCPLPFKSGIKEEVERAKSIGAHGVFVSDKYDFEIVEGTDKNPIALDDVRLCFLTSGSSGNRKFITLTKGNIAAATYGIQERLKYKETDVVASVLPQSFDYGFYQYLLCKKADCTLLLFDEGYSIQALKSMCRLGATVLPGVPSMLASMATVASRVMKNNSIRLITSTGEAFSEGLLSKLELVFPRVDIASMYGLTECKRVSIHPTSKGEGRGSVGKPIHGCQVWIDAIDENGMGEIVVDGPNVSNGMFEINKNSSSPLAISNKPLYTGDYGYIDEHGYLYVSGRKDDLVKISGMRHSLKEIEDYLYDQETFNLVKLTVSEGVVHVLYKSISNSEQGVKQMLVDKFGVHMSTVKVNQVDDLKLTENLKLDGADVA